MNTTAPSTTTTESEAAANVVKVVAILKTKPGREAEVRQSLLDLAEATRRESGCIHYEIAQPDNEASTFVFYETWRSRADLDAHFGKPYFQALLARGPELLAAPSDVKIMSPVTR